MQNTPRTKKVFILWLLPALSVGIVLRLWNLETQVLGGDELHTVNIALQNSLEKILFTYRISDHCIPLTVFYRLLIDWGVVMSEMIFRLPVLLSGFLLLMALPLAVENKVGRTAAVLFALLLALSPLMVFYSRIVRSYMPVLFFSFTAVMSFYAWWRGRGLRWGLVYVLLSGLSIYFHLGVVPFVTAPLLYGAGELLMEHQPKGGKRPGWRELFALGLCLMLALATFLVPARKSLFELIKTNRQEFSLPLDTLLDVLHLQAGTDIFILTVLFWIAVMAGLVLLLRRQIRFGVYSLTLVTCQLVGLMILSPSRLNEPLIFNRYVLVILPFVLLWLAVALTNPWWPRKGTGILVVQGCLVGSFICALVLGGPFTDAELRTTSFAHHNSFIGFIASRGRLPEEAVPKFYYKLSEEPGSNPVIECPFPIAWDYSNNLHIYQRIHRQDVLVATYKPALNDPRLNFKNMSRLHPEDLLSSRARYLIVHLRWLWEINQVVDAEWVFSPVDLNLCHELHQMAQRLTMWLEQLWGDPVYKDRLIQVWDLEQIRNRKKD